MLFRSEKHLDYVGQTIRNGVESLAQKHGIAIKISGINPLLHFEFEYENPLVYKTFFTQEMLEQGYLASNAVYACYAHNDEVIQGYLRAVDKTFAVIEQLNGNMPILKGEVCHSGFQRLT